MSLIVPRSLAALAALLIAGCGSVPGRARLGDQPPAPIGIRLPLDDIGATGTLTQRVVGSFRGQTRTLRFEVELTRNRLAIVALTPLGLPVFAVTYDGERSNVKTYAENVPLPLPDWILDDVLIANAPAAVLREALADKQYGLEEGAATRTVADAGGRTLVRIHYTEPGTVAWGRDLVLNDDVLHYELVVTTLTKTRQAREP